MIDRVASTRSAESMMNRKHRAAGLLVASSGGHLLQLLQIRGVLPDAHWTWVTFDTPDALSLLRDESVVYAHHPTNRNLVNLARNAFLAIRVVWRTRPRVVVSTGAGVAVPFCYVARFLGAKVLFIESFARTTNLSLSGKLVRPIATRFFVQWPETAPDDSKAEYLGALFSSAPATAGPDASVEA